MSDSKKPGQTTVVIQYYSLSRFFLKQTLDPKDGVYWLNFLEGFGFMYVIEDDVQCRYERHIEIERMIF